jgi:hypothetical protein
MLLLENRFLKAFALLMGLAVAGPVEARVFDMSESLAAAYVRGTGGLSNVGDEAYANTSGTTTRFDEEVQYNFGGEVGFAFPMGESVVLRTGFEGLQTRELRDAGKTAAGGALLNVESTIVAFHPNVALEFNFMRSPKTRTFFFVGAGYATVKVTNNYDLTTEGVAAYSATQNSYKDAWKTTAMSYQLGGGFEFFILDNVTMAFDAGWRFLPTSGYTYNANANVVRAGSMRAVTAGGDVIDDRGRKPELDLGGAFAGISFKFYLPPL